MPLARGVLALVAMLLLGAAPRLPAVPAVLAVSMVPSALAPCERLCFATETVDSPSIVGPNITNIHDSYDTGSK